MKLIKNFLSAIVLNLKINVIKLSNNLPLSLPQKQKLKNFVFTYLGFLFKNSLRYKYWLIFKCENNQNSRISELSNDTEYDQPGTIAMHLHLFYIDLLDEFVEYIANMPFYFDLYISITNCNHEKIILQKMSGLERIQKITVVTVQNKGRDVAPMVVTFAKDLMLYDYICHIHTKKSMHAGHEQKNWRYHLLHNLLGSANVIRTIFTIFRMHSDIGIVYPETYHNIPYWTQTWLSNKNLAKQLLNMLQIDPDLPDYVDYPAGTMFWARSDAVKPLLELGLGYENFTEEKGQIDGTIAHAIEHSLVIIVQDSGRHLCEVNFEQDIYRLYCGSRNLWQYWEKNRDHLKSVIRQVDFVSFDILDALITRPFLNNNDIFKIIGIRIKKNLDLDFDFETIRKEAEKRAKKNKKACCIDDIYFIFQSMACLDAKLCDLIKKMEMHEIENLVFRRQDIVDIYNFAKSINKRIIILSDLGLERQAVSGLLKKAGIGGYHDILITSELNMRKDTGEIWDYYEHNFKNQKGIHIGHDEHADIQMLSDRNIPFYHVMSGRNLFYNTKLGHLFDKKCRGKILIGDSLLIGTLIAREFNSPFCLFGTRGSYIINDFRTLGYVVFGPVAFAYIMWLARKKQDNYLSCLYFRPSEHCMANKLFDIVSKAHGKVSNLSGSTFVNSGISGIVDTPEMLNIQAFQADNHLESSTGNHYFFFYHANDTLSVCDIPQAHFFAESRPLNKFHLLLLTVLTATELINDDSQTDKNALSDLSAGGFSKDMISQASDGIYQYFSDILQKNADLLMEMPFSGNVTEFFLDILDSDLVNIEFRLDKTAIDNIQRPQNMASII